MAAPFKFLVQPVQAGERHNAVFGVAAIESAYKCMSLAKRRKLAKLGNQACNVLTRVTAGV